jgi:hypothetical protein
MNHGPDFWAEVEKVLPNYLDLITQLKVIEKTGLMHLSNISKPHILGTEAK